MVVVFWVVVAAVAYLQVPSFGSTSGPVVQLVPRNAPALKALALSLRLFRVPAGSEFAVVVRDPRGLSVQAHAAVFAQALAIDGGHHPAEGPVFALPVVDTLGLVPGSKDAGTTAITFLYYPQSAPVSYQMRSARAYVRRLSQATGRPAGLTGAIPGQFTQGVLIDQNLTLVELMTLLLIIVIVAVNYRSVTAPLVALAAIAVAFPIALVVLSKLTTSLGVFVPQELDPLVVALLLGIITDYSIFFLSGVRNRIGAGEPKHTAARSTAAEFSPIILTSGLILACGLLGLLASTLGFFQNLGPVLAATVAIGLVVGVTLLPALLAILGELAYWPTRVGAQSAAHGTVNDPMTRRTQRLAYRMTSRPIAALIALACIALLLIASLQARDLKLGFGQITDLPTNTAPQRAAHDATAGFAAGILAPTTIVVQRAGVANGLVHTRLAELESSIGRQPGVAAVVGPREQPTPRTFGVFLAPSGNAARIVVLFSHDPLSATGIHDLQHLQAVLPGLVRRAVLAGAKISIAGDTALANDTVSAIHSDIVRVTTVVLLVNLFLLIVFLRGLVAPLFLLASSVGAVAATMGITTWTFQTYLGYHQIDYYVPFAVCVLLISLGSDYNVFVVGRIWQEARERPIREAIAVAAPNAARTIRTAGITLAGSFAVIALIPLRSFREVAFAMVIGLLMETLFVRSLLVPALIALFGTASGWPGHRLQNVHHPHHRAQRAGAVSPTPAAPIADSQ